ncbi:MAG: hypothetical protein KDA71_03720, partial [Planctomycetales bacterium]|nr:hypothetical protein [Planctomycetales bacterium]
MLGDALVDEAPVGEVLLDEPLVDAGFVVSESLVGFAVMLAPRTDSLRGTLSPPAPMLLAPLSNELAIGPFDSVLGDEYTGWPLAPKEEVVGCWAATAGESSPEESVHHKTTPISRTAAMPPTPTATQINGFIPCLGLPPARIAGDCGICGRGDGEAGRCATSSAVNGAFANCPPAFP